METPHFDHLSVDDFEKVYEPAEDSFLLLDALESDLLFLKELQPSVCVEIGSGSGVVITALSKICPNNSISFATDINEFACTATRRTAQRNGTHVDVIQSNLLDAIRSHSIDLLVFNPPYVLTTDEELEHKRLDEACVITSHKLIPSWAGGSDGRRVINELLATIGEKMSPNSVFYLLVLRENKPDEIMRELKAIGFNVTKFMERRIPGEHLYILKSVRV